LRQLATPTYPDSVAKGCLAVLVALPVLLLDHPCAVASGWRQRGARLRSRCPTGAAIRSR